jgi:hypothetical protein
MSFFEVHSEEEMERLLKYMKELWSKKGIRDVHIGISDPFMAKIVMSNIKKEFEEYQMHGLPVQDPELVEIMFIHNESEGDIT